MELIEQGKKVRFIEFYRFYVTAPYIMPAPYAFSIWILIYLLLGIWLISQFFVSDGAFKVYEKVSRFFAINMLFTGGSLLVSNTWAPVMIGMSLVTLILMYNTMNRAILTLKVEKQDRILKELKYVRVPFSIFMGWVSVALMVDVAIVLKANGFTQLLGLGEQLWGIIMLIVGGFLAIYTRNTSDDILYPLVFIWAYIAIAIFNMSTFPILITACGVIVMIAFFLEKQPKVYR